MKTSQTVKRIFNDDSKCDCFELELSATICPTILAEKIELSEEIVYLPQIDGIADIELVPFAATYDIKNDKNDKYWDAYVEQEARKIRDSINPEKADALSEEEIERRIELMASKWKTNKTNKTMEPLFEDEYTSQLSQEQCEKLIDMCDQLLGCNSIR